MSPSPLYPKRLIEVDLPIKEISQHARREKSIRHGHISTLHIWWARKPLVSCRAVICAALWPDPADPLCPEPFRTEAKKQMDQFWNQLDATSHDLEDAAALRTALLDFIADFANWDNSTDERYLNTARALTQSAHEALGGAPGTRPLVVDPFAGGGSIPLEALRVGADAYASDLNPVAVLLNKVVLEYIPKYGKELADEVRKWGQWVKAEAEKELAEYYPKDPDGSTPIAYLWARTITCEGPGCGAEVPLLSSLIIAKKKNRNIFLKMDIDKIKKQILFEINEKSDITVAEGTIKRGSAVCPVCGFTTSIASVRKQMKTQEGGTDQSRLICVVTMQSGIQGRNYRLPIDQDYKAVERATQKISTYKNEMMNQYSAIPCESTPPNSGHRAVSSVRLYGMNNYSSLFSKRQLLSMITLSKMIIKSKNALSNYKSADEIKAIITLLSLALDKQADLGNALTRWKADAECPVNLFGRQAIPISWLFAESVILSHSSGSWESMYERTANAIKNNVYPQPWSGQIEMMDAVNNSLPNESANVFFSDPPYYDAVPYADLSDFFYVWLKRILRRDYPDLFEEELTPKNEQAIVWHPNSLEEKKEFERKMTLAMGEGRRILSSKGIGVVVFAHKSTSGWEAQLQAMIDAGWIITASWPIDTEMGSRMNAMGTASLASSIHLVCRPRENPDGSLRTDDVGDWRDVLHELPIRIHEWMPRLAVEGVVGADAIFACLGPALEIYSRYSRVEKPNGEQVLLREYLEKVWEAVAREALRVIFHDADTSGFEEDARVTAMWLWTLSTGGENGTTAAPSQDDDETGDEEEKPTSKKGSAKGGFALEYDAARKIAQGLGAHLEEMRTLVEVKGDTARLLPVSERAHYLFGKPGVAKVPVIAKRKGKQLTLGESTGEDAKEAIIIAKASMDVEYDLVLGKTVLDSVHQSMLLFGAGRSDALKTFLVDNAAGKDPRFWRLAQALSALYPKSSEEKRWVDGVLARKKGLGL